VKPEIRSNRIKATVLLGFGRDYTLYLNDGEYLGRVYSLPKFSLFGGGLFREWHWFCNVTLTNGRTRTAQAATDAIVMAYERFLDAEPGKSCPSCHGSAITTDGDGYAECGDCQCVFLVNAE
jgi:hypothetical protein